MDKALKQRLVGASVLVALAVVILPMLLSGQPGSPQETRSIELPPKPAELDFETRRFPIGEQPPGEPTTLTEIPSRDPAGNTADVGETGSANPGAAAQAGDADPATGEGVRVSAAPPPTEQAGSGSDTATVDATPADSTATGEPPPLETVSTPVVIPSPQVTPEGRYLVQVASFSSTANANRLAGLLRDNNLPVLMDTVETNAGTLHRVRVGPYADRATADRAIATLNDSVPDLNPRIMDLRPDETTTVDAPSDPLVRWVVQMGVFSARENADRLVFDLRDAGYRASTSAVSQAAGTVWRVRVGPVIERDEAVSLADNIQRDLGLEGLVMSAD